MIWTLTPRKIRPKPLLFFHLRRAFLGWKILLSVFVALYICTGLLLRFAKLAQKKPLESEWRGVITAFMNTAPASSFKTSKIIEHFNANENLAQNVSILVTINGDKLKISSPENLTAGQGRFGSAKYMLEKLVRSGRLQRRLAGRNVTFSIMLHDCHRPKVATFGSARHWESWKTLFPIPLGNDRGVNEGWGTQLSSWDTYINRTVTSTHEKYPWYKKLSRAVFRGSLGMQRYNLGSCNKINSGRCQTARNWRQVNRGVLAIRSEEDASIFDVGFVSYRRKNYAPFDQLDGAPTLVNPIPYVDFQKFKLILNVGSNQDWAERLRTLLFMNSAVVLHEAETKEFFTALLKPWVHYIPINIMMSDLVKNVRWAISHDMDIMRIAAQANIFANRYISEASMTLYWLIAIEEFSKRQEAAQFL